MRMSDLELNLEQKGVRKPNVSKKKYRPLCFDTLRTVYCSATFLWFHGDGHIFIFYPMQNSAIRVICGLFHSHRDFLSLRLL